MSSHIKQITPETFVDSLIAIVHYGKFPLNSRNHFGANYIRSTIESAKFANEGEKILIDYGWLEQPPMAPDRKKLAK